MGKFKRKKDDHVIFTDPAEPKHIPPFLAWKYIGYEATFVFIGLIGAAGLGCIPILLFLVLGDVIQGMSTPPVQSSSLVVANAVAVMQKASLANTFNRLAAKMSYIAIGAFAAALLMFFFLNLAHGRIGTRLKRAYFDSLLDQEIGYFDMKRTGQLLNDMTESMEIIQEGHTNKIGELVTNVAQFVFAIIMSLIKGWKMSLVMISVIPLFAIVLFFTGVIVSALQKLINVLNGRAASISNEVVSSIRTIRSMDGEEREKKRFYHQLLEAHKLYLGKGAVMAITIGFAMFCNWADIALGFWYGGRLVDRGEMNFGELFQVFAFVMMGILGVGQGLRVVPEFGKANQSVVDLMKVIRRVPLLRVSGGVQPAMIEGHIEFKHVSFSYPTRPNMQVLRNFSLTINPGQSVALVGASGSGKSTIVGLLERFYQPDSGEIYLDGVNIADIDPRWLHRNIGIVTQEPTLFASTIKENILYAVKQSNRQVTDEDVINAAKAANAHDFIMALPSGYQTVLGERGVSMSGGQKQRIAIARAMIQDPKLLLLDEATSALDTQSESVVQEALDKLMKGRTSIVIAHRLSTVIDSDVICVMNKGELKEKGTHHELLKINDGYYYKLASKQMMFSQAGTGENSDTTSEPNTDSNHVINMPTE